MGFITSNPRTMIGAGALYGAYKGMSSYPGSDFTGAVMNSVPNIIGGGLMGAGIYGASRFGMNAYSRFGKLSSKFPTFAANHSGILMKKAIAMEGRNVWSSLFNNRGRAFNAIASTMKKIF